MQHGRLVLSVMPLPLASSLLTYVHACMDPCTCSKYLVRASYLQIYNEVISDLLKVRAHMCWASQG